MANRLGVEVARSMAEKMSISKLVEEHQKTNDSEIRDEIGDIIRDRRHCPECGNEMMLDESAAEMYCPIGCFEFDYEL